MKCPNCNKELDVRAITYANADVYRKAVLAKSECCGKAVVIVPVRKYEVYPYVGNRTKDDWGSKFLPVESNTTALTNQFMAEVTE